MVLFIREINTFLLQDWKLLILLAIVLAVYYHYTSTFDFFKKKGIPYIKPTIFLGNLGPRLTGLKSFHEIQLDIYNYFKGHPYGGIFEGRQPVLYVFDPELIRAITTRDFSHFVDRTTIDFNEPKYLKRSLSNLKGSEWKGVRSALTPSFSSARLKEMLPLIRLCSDRLIGHLTRRGDCDIELKDAMGHYTLEIIGICAFGINPNALGDENSHLCKVAEKMTEIPILTKSFILFVLMTMPKAVKYLNISFLNTKYTDQLAMMLKATKAERKKSKIEYKDYMKLILDAAEKEMNSEDNGATKYFDEDTVDAQLMFFLMAGYETSSSVLSFAIYFLAKHPDIQTKLRDHIEEVTKGQEITYELLAELPYLEALILETIRMYPPISQVDRVCTKAYNLPGTKVRINKGDVVSISISGIHRDPKYFPNPTEFRPERFMEKDQSQFYLGFGIGPKSCIGLRFAMVSIKFVLIALLKNFKISTCTKTEDPVKIDRHSILLKSEHGVWVRINKLSHT